MTAVPPFPWSVVVICAFLYKALAGGSLASRPPSAYRATERARATNARPSSSTVVPLLCRAHFYRLNITKLLLLLLKRQRFTY